MEDIIYKNLSYKIVGLAYEIFNSIGSELKEKIYANAFEELLIREKISYKREVYYPIKINDKVIGKGFFDLFIDNKIIVELKCGNQKYKEACNQLFQYLKMSDIKLGIIIRFTKDGVKIKRIPNLY